MKVKVINIEGNKSRDIELSDKIFSLKPNKTIIQSHRASTGYENLMPNIKLWGINYL